jgi:hypothetical protein
MIVFTQKNLMRVQFILQTKILSLWKIAEKLSSKALFGSYLCVKSNKDELVLVKGVLDNNR